MGSLSSTNIVQVPAASAASTIGIGTSGASGGNQARAHRVAKQFEAMFMTEMLHQAHSKSHAVGVFRTGSGESTMQPFMDQALGDAVASRGGTGIAQSIERLLIGPTAGRSGK
jgi:peptidoglycan hydrolase FlgJ